MNINDIIGQGLTEIDSKKPLLKYLEKNTKIIIDYKSEPNRSEIKFYDKETDKLIISSDFERLAAYYGKYNIWVWAWSLPLLLHSENSLSIEILKHTLQLGPEYTYIKTLFTTSRGISADPVQIDINMALCEKILKKPHIMKYTDTRGIVEWYLVMLNKEGMDKLESELESKLKDYEF